MITISIDLRKIDQSRCKKMVLRSGENASFCNLVLIETPNSEYGDYMVKQDTTKEEREQKVQMPILGNGKTVGKKPQRQQKPDERPSQRRERPATPERRERPAPTERRRPPADPDIYDEPRDDIPF